MKTQELTAKLDFIQMFILYDHITKYVKNMVAVIHGDH